MAELNEVWESGNTLVLCLATVSMVVLVAILFEKIDAMRNKKRTAKFKIGDRIKDDKFDGVYTIEDIFYNYYEFKCYYSLVGIDMVLDLDYCDSNYKLVQEETKFEDNINTEKAKSILKDYVDNLKLPKEIETRVLNMYLSEMEHIYSMMQSAKLLKPFKRIWYGNEFNSNDFLVKNEEDLTNKAIENVNKIFRKFMQ